MYLFICIIYRSICVCISLSLCDCLSILLSYSFFPSKQQKSIKVPNVSISSFQKSLVTLMISMLFENKHSWALRHKNRTPPKSRSHVGDRTGLERLPVFKASGSLGASIGRGKTSVVWLFYGISSFSIM